MGHAYCFGTVELAIQRGREFKKHNHSRLVPVLCTISPSLLSAVRYFTKLEYLSSELLAAVYRGLSWPYTDEIFKGTYFPTSDTLDSFPIKSSSVYVVFTPHVSLWQLNYVLNTLLSLHMVIAFIVAIILDNTVPGSRQERGVYVWSEAEAARREPAMCKDYELPFRVGRMFRWVKWVGL